MPVVWGAAFGVVLVGSGGRTIEVATFRSDGAYIDSRHPVEVTFGTAQEDAAAGGFHDQRGSSRILKMGTLLTSLMARRISPHAYSGRSETPKLASRRTIFGCSGPYGSPHASDSRSTMQPPRRWFPVPLVSKVSQENALLRNCDGCSPTPVVGTAAALLERFGLDASILGPSMGKPNGIERVIDLGEDSTWVQALVAWVLDRGVDAEGLLVARQLTERLVLSNQERDEVAGILETRSQLLKDWQEMSIAARKRLLAGPHARRALEVLAAEDPGLHDRLSREIDPLLDQGVAPTPLITGGDLLHAGFKEGPGLGKIPFLRSMTHNWKAGSQTSQAALKFAEELRRG